MNYRSLLTLLPLLFKLTPAVGFQAQQKHVRPLPFRHHVERASSALSMTPTGRRDALVALIGTSTWLAQALPSIAADNGAAAENPFDLVRFELYDANGGVAVMQKRIDDRDFEGLLEFTKGYDQVLRKRYMGKAKKLLPKELQDKATIACNSVTFDLIGINRNSRKGQESYEGASKYLAELKQDAESLLALESSIVATED